MHIPLLKEKLDRRIHRFWYTIQNKPILFIRTDTTLEEGAIKSGIG